uniref:DNMT3 ADD domain-containing protein n=1 Tax=Daphnia galeata TaxID=27404 RepID=A0A8J2RJI3_9CRUS|nr:unnamed protein product [Daphnia galeata]
MEHLLFCGSLCNRECKNELLATSYSIGEDDMHVSFAICGSTGDCLVCENGSCSRVFCSYCVELLVGEGSMSLRSFLHQDLPRPNESTSVQERATCFIRVVVLHDNLGAVNYALGSLRLALDQYMAYDRWQKIYELNGRELSVLKKANKIVSDSFTRLVPTSQEIRSIASHKPAGQEVGRKQFSEREYGKAFFDLFHIKNCIERNNKETPLLWAVENVNSYHITISRFLEMEPVIFDMKDAQGSAKHRLVFWRLTFPDRTQSRNWRIVYHNDHSKA